MILDAASKSIQVVLGATVVSSQLSCVASWADLSTSSFVPGAADVQTNGTTPVTLVAAPGAGVQRQIKSVTVYNDDSANATVAVHLISGVNTRSLVKVTLQPGWTLQYGENSWTVVGGSGSLTQAAASVAAGADKQLQFNDGGTALGADQNLTWDKTNRILGMAGTAPSLQLSGTEADPAVPATGKLDVFAQTIASRSMLAQLGPSGMSTAMQPLLARNKAGFWNPPGNATTVPGVFALTAPTALGTATVRNVATTSLAARMRRLGYVSATTTGSLAGHYLAKAQFSCGGGSNNGSGFFFVCRFVPSSASAVSGMRMFVGMTSSVSAPTNVETNTLTNVVGVGQLGTDTTQLYVFYAGSSVQTPIPLGATNFPGQTLSTEAYELAIFSPPSPANTYYVQVTNITTGAMYNTTLTGDATVVPQSTTLLSYEAYVSNNAAAVAAGIDICSVYIETDV